MTFSETVDYLAKTLTFVPYGVLHEALGTPRNFYDSVRGEKVETIDTNGFFKTTYEAKIALQYSNDFLSEEFSKNISAKPQRSFIGRLAKPLIAAFVLAASPSVAAEQVCKNWDDKTVCYPQAPPVLDRDYDGIDDDLELSGPYRHLLNPERQDALVEVDYHRYNDDRYIEFCESTKDELVAKFSERNISLYIETKGVEELGGGQLWTTNESQPLTANLALSFRRDDRGFIPDREDAFHYVVLSSRSLIDPSKGPNHAIGGQGFQPGKTFTILDPGNCSNQVETFMHELGHNFGLSHTEDRNTIMCQINNFSCLPRVRNYTESEWNFIKTEGLRKSFGSGFVTEKPQPKPVEKLSQTSNSSQQNPGTSIMQSEPPHVYVTIAKGKPDKVLSIRDPSEAYVGLRLPWFGLELGTKPLLFGIATYYMGKFIGRRGESKRKEEDRSDHDVPTLPPYNQSELEASEKSDKN